MTTMVREVYEALKEAGASDETAAKAAEAVEAVREEGRLRRIEDRLTAMEGRMLLLQWMIGFNIALTAAILAKLLIPG